MKPGFFSTPSDFRVVLKNVNYNLVGCNQQDNQQDKIVSFCVTPRTRKEIAAHCGYKDLRNFTSRRLKPLLESGLLCMTVPDKPSSKYQKYVAVGKVEE